MNILLTNHHMHAYTGTEVYTYTLAVALHRAGHRVTVYTKYPGVMTERLSDNDISWTNNLETIQDKKFDVAHVHHLTCAYEVRLAFPRLPMVFQAHGVGIKAVLEQPPAIDIHISHFLAIAEDVEERLKMGGHAKNISISRNGFDTRLFHSIQPIWEKPTHALIISNKITPRKLEIITKALDKLKISHTHVGSENAVPNDILPRFINGADIVFTLGRGVVEALLCRRAVFIYDKNSADGMVTSQNYENFKKTHFSGLSRNKEYTSAQIVSEIKKYYEPEDVKKLSLIARKEFDIDIVLKSLLGVYTQSIARPPKELSKNTKDAVRQILELISAENLYAAQELRKFQDSKLYNVWRGYEVLKKLTKLQKR